MVKIWRIFMAMGILVGCGGAPEEKTAAVGVVEDLGGITVTVPGGWSSEPPSNSMRKAQYRLPGDAGDAELVVTYFGTAGAGGVEANIARWRGQFKDSDGGSVKTLSVSGMNVTVLDISGSFAGMQRPMGGGGEAKTGQRMLAAVVENAQGAFYFKLVGPKATVTQWQSSFDQFVNSIRVSGGKA